MGTDKKTVRVYTRPNCQACEATKRRLTNRDIPFEADDITTEANLGAAKALGHRASTLRRRVKRHTRRRGVVVRPHPIQT